MSSSQDPFILVKNEVEENIQIVDKLYGQWERVLEQAPNSDDQRRLESTILDQIKEIMDDLGDLEETVSIALKNPSRFNFSDQELKSRSEFIRAAKSKLTGMEATITSPDTQAKAKANARSLLLKKRGEGKQARYAKLDEAIAQDNQKFIEDQEQEQLRIEMEQEEDLQALGRNVRKIKEMGRDIGSEIQNQQKQLDDLSNDVDRVDNKMENSIIKINKIIGETKKDRIFTIIIVILVLILIGVILAASLV